MSNIQQLEAGPIASKIFALISTSLTHFSWILNYWPIASFLLLTFMFAWIVRSIFLFKYLLSEKSVFLEIIPPARTEQSAYSTEQLFVLINSLGSHRTLFERMLGRRTFFSLEIVSTQKEGIRYLIRTNSKEANTLKRSLLSYLPQIRVNIVKDYLPNTHERESSILSVSEFKLSKHFALPLKQQGELSEHDPIAYVTGMMTKLAKNELISLQFLVSPVKVKEARKISQLILYNSDTLQHIFSSSHFILLGSLFKLVAAIILLPFWLLSALLNNGNTSYVSLPFGYRRSIKNVSSFEQELISSIKNKVEQPLFESSIRLLVKVSNKTEASERLRGFRSSLASFSGHEGQSIRQVKRLRLSLMNRLQVFAFQKRLPLPFSKSLLSVSELSSIYHFPYTKVTKTENIVKSHSKVLPAPLSLKKGNVLDVIFAKNTYGGSTTQIGLTHEERKKHMYIIGATGSGKTTMITSMVSQDILNGKGVAVIDPHGDLAETLLTCIPKGRTDDLIYVNPDDLKYPIGINLLEISPNLDEDDLLREKEFITESVISLFRKVFSESMGGHAHRIEYILRNTIQTALTLEDPTLFTIYELLNNPPFQKRVTANLEDENLKNFWKFEYGKAGDYQKVKMISPVAARIGRFLFSPSAKRMLEQKKSTINFDEILNQKKILICNLAKGKLGEDTSEVLGIMIIAKIQLASLRRARKEAKTRTPFYMYVDEFQNFATPSFIQMLSEARKYKTYLVMAEQSTSQQKDKNLVNVILANVGTVVSFRSANPDDERLMLPQFAPYIESGDISNLPRYNFYIKISAVEPEESFSGTTIPLDITYNKVVVETIIQSSRDKYAIEYVKPVSTKSSITKVQKADIKSNDVSDIALL